MIENNFKKRVLRFEQLLLILFIDITIYFFFRHINIPLIGVILCLVFPTLILAKPKIKIPDEFIRNFTIGAAIILIVLFLLLDSIRDKDIIRIFPFIIYFLAAFAVLAALIRIFRVSERNFKRSVIGFITLLLFLGAAFKHPSFGYLIPLSISLTILSFIMILEIIFIYKKEEPDKNIPLSYFLMIIPTVVVALVFSVVLMLFIPDLVKFVDKNVIATGPGVSGFSNISRIGDIQKIKLSKRVVMRVSGDNPFYIHGNVYDEVRINENHYDWRSKNQFKELEPDKNGKIILQTLNPDLESEFINTKIFLKTISHTKHSILFTPSNPTQFISKNVNIKFDSIRNIIRLIQYRNLIEYQIISLPNQATEIQMEQKYLYLPNNITEKYHELALNIKGNAADEQEIIENLGKFFLENKFKYSLQIKISKTRDPIHYFLTRSKSGYCEYYATASVILLRLMGVKTRYVSGFIVSEQTKDKTSFIVRALHAHAWVEYYEDKTGTWKVFDPTTYATGFDWNEGFQPTKFEIFFEGLLFKLQKIRNSFGMFSLDDVRYQLQRLISDFTFNMILLGLVILYVVLRLVFSKEKIKFSFFSRKKKVMVQISIEEKEWRILLLYLEKTLSLNENNLRIPSETFREYLTRILETDLDSGLYQLANEIIDSFYLYRFRGDIFTIADIRKFKTDLEEISNRIRK